MRTTPLPPSRSRRRRWGRWLVLALLILIVLPIAVLWWMGSAEPEYWAVLDADAPAVRAGGQRFERRLSSQLTRVRPAEERWQLHIDQREVNQWLAARLPRWLANRGVEERVTRALRNPMVAIRDDHIEVAARADLPGMDSVVRLRYRPRIEDGRVRLVLQEIRAGRIPLSLDYVMDSIIERAEDEARETIIAAVHELSSIDLTLPLGDGRRVRATDLELNDGAMVLTCRTARVKE